MDSAGSERNFLVLCQGLLLFFSDDLRSGFSVAVVEVEYVEDAYSAFWLD